MLAQFWQISANFSSFILYIGDNYKRKYLLHRQGFFVLQKLIFLALNIRNSVQYCSLRAFRAAQI